ncbi:transcription factor Adf-1-like isoform X1 [Argiope bruennichi]|uniref:transcription factor Adf-1-like isoform X1 n=1 Tax=Argiope bruennichi TaxID=94029 RepID=UPI0024950544|nr:transcription factor Adf-1-like isoform X1 [Argiope bruennichi]
MASDDDEMPSEVIHTSEVLTSKSKFDELKLIQLIKARPAIYDPHHPKHRYRTYIDHLWNEVANEMGASVYDLRNKWHVLRCCFNRAMKETQSGNRRSGKQWHLYNAMLFIKNFLRKRKNSVQTSAENSATLQSQDNIAGNVEFDCEVSPSNSSPSLTKHHLVIFDDGTTQLVPAKRLKTDHFSSPENIMLQSSKSKSMSEDTNELFLRSLLPDMSKLNPSKLRHFKTFVITKLTNLLDEQDAESVTRDLADGLASTYVLESTSVDS